MKKNIIIISDLYRQDFVAANAPCGGAELNDDVLFSHLEKLGLVKQKIHSNEYDTKSMISFVEQNKDCTFLISNFSNLHFRVTAKLLKDCRYFIYEHDYKFHKLRNPLKYKNFIVPKNELVNINFFKKAQEVICLSKLHKDIFFENLKLKNLHNTTCSLWSDETLNFIQQNNKNEKNNKLAIVNTDNPIKRKRECIQYCLDNNLKFDLISSPDYNEFLKILSNYKGIVILPGHPEPTPRVAVEAKMLNCEVYSNPKSLGVFYEDWFKLSGDDLIESIRNIKKNTLEYITERIAK